MNKGTICSLTGNKPEFNNKCQNIQFENNYEKIIREVNINLHLVRLTKTDTVLSVVVFLPLSIAVMAAGYLIGRYAWESGVISTVPLIIMGVGFLVMPLATGPLNKYRQTYGVAKKRKQQLDDLLSSYNIEYTIDVSVRKDFHGNQEVETDLRFLRKHFK